MNMLAMDWFSNSTHHEEYEDYFLKEEICTDDENEESNYAWEFLPKTIAKSGNTPHNLYAKNLNVIQLQPSCSITL